MKKLVFALALFSSPAMAYEGFDVAFNNLDVLKFDSAFEGMPKSENGGQAEFCEAVGELAEATMRAKQAGVPTWKLRQHHSKADAPMKELLEKIIVDAYEQPAFQTYEEKDMQRREFAHVWSVACYNALRSK